MGKKKQRQKAQNKKQNQQPSIMVGMPIHNYMENFTGMCMDQTTSDLRELGIGFRRVSPIGIPDVARARNTCVDVFLKEKRFTHLMWIDADMVWDTDAVLSLLNLGVPACSALVTKKAPPFNVTLFQLLKPTEDSKTLNTYDVPLGAYPMDEPFRFPNSGIGTAFMLLERRVIESMEPPYFTGFVDPVRKTLKGTDYYFCVRMLQKGFEFVYDPRPSVYHVGKCLFGVEDHVAYLDQLAEKGIEACQFMNLDASVVEFKKTFAGPQPSLIEKIASVVEQQKELSALQAGSRSVASKCPSLEKDDPTRVQTKTGIEVVKSPKDSDLTSLPPRPEKEPMKTMSADGQ